MEAAVTVMAAAEDLAVAMEEVEDLAVAMEAVADLAEDTEEAVALEVVMGTLAAED